MPNLRFGFGNNLLKDLLETINYHGSRFGYDYQYICDASSAIQEYLSIHSNNMHLLEEQNVSSAQSLLKTMESVPSFVFHSQDVLDASECFQNADSYRNFAMSRRSYRYFDGSPVSKQKILDAISLARHAPSSCNRQSSHVHIYSNKSIVSDLLALQGGSRGYGHLGDTLLLITSNLKMTIHVNERHMPFVDGGIFYMALLYALHSYRIACCPLNCYFPPKVEREVRKLSGIAEYEAIVAMIICGNISGSINVVKSPRFPVEYFYTEH